MANPDRQADPGRQHLAQPGAEIPLFPRGAADRSADRVGQRHRRQPAHPGTDGRWPGRAARRRSRPGRQRVAPACGRRSSADAARSQRALRSRPPRSRSAGVRDLCRDLFACTASGRGGRARSVPRRPAGGSVDPHGPAIGRPIEPRRRLERARPAGRNRRPRAPVGATPNDALAASAGSARSTPPDRARRRGRPRPDVGSDGQWARDRSPAAANGVDRADLSICRTVSCAMRPTRCSCVSRAPSPSSLFSPARRRRLSPCLP